MCKDARWVKGARELPIAHAGIQDPSFPNWAMFRVCTEQDNMVCYSSIVSVLSFYTDSALCVRHYSVSDRDGVAISAHQSHLCQWLLAASLGSLSSWRSMFSLPTGNQGVLGVEVPRIGLQSGLMSMWQDVSQLLYPKRAA